MNKQEILEELSGKFYKLGSVTMAGNAIDQTNRKAEGVNWYLVAIYEKHETDEVLVRRNIPIYVVDEGTETEKAFYGEKVPEKILAVKTAETVVETEQKSLISRILGR
jgi:hypothetical protein